MKTLLEKANELDSRTDHQRRQYTEEEMELAEAWFKNKVSSKSVLKVLKIKTQSNIYQFLAIAYKRKLNDKLPF